MIYAKKETSGDTTENFVLNLKNKYQSIIPFSKFFASRNKNLIY